MLFRSPIELAMEPEEPGRSSWALNGCQAVCWGVEVKKIGAELRNGAAAAEARDPSPQDLEQARR